MRKRSARCKESPATAIGPARIVVGLNAVIVAVTNEAPRLLTVRRTSHELSSYPGSDPGLPPLDTLPYGPLDADEDRTLERGLRRWVLSQTGLELGYVEQLYTFGDRHREPLEARGGPRVLSVGYLALIREGLPSGAGEAQWRDWYDFLPWEDWRHGRPEQLAAVIAPALAQWTEATPLATSRRERRERVEIAFGLRGAPWDGERVLERYELLYEAGLVAEAARDGGGGAAMPENLGREMAHDHRRILATALGRLRGKLRYRPVVFELLAETFTLLQLQRVVEALAGLRLHKQNFRRVLETARLVEGTGHLDSRTGGRPAERFRFRREALRERPAPGIGLPGVKS
jgi:hypothetical protein